MWTSPPEPNLNLQDLKEVLKQKALDLGFHLFGVAATGPFPEMKHFENWLQKDYAAGMKYMAERRAERADLQKYFPAARSVISLGIYYAKKSSPPEQTEKEPKIARYALGRDYHNVLRKKLRKLENFLHTQISCQSRICLDTAPVLDRVYAYHAGLGWFGKNTCLITRRNGSDFFIAEILTDLELPMDAMESDHCGTCRRCLDVCPTQAFPEPYVLDANRCISYWTIEHRGDIPDEMASKIGPHFFGCDLCQEVCPWNHPHQNDKNQPPPSVDPAFQPTQDAVDVVRKLDGINAPDFAKDFQGSPLKRARLDGLLRNASIVEKNCASKANF